MEWLTLICSIIGILFKVWQDVQPAIQEVKANEKREDIADSNVDAVSARIDSLCKQAGDSSGLQSDEDTQRRIARITGS